MIKTREKKQASNQINERVDDHKQLIIITKYTLIIFIRAEMNNNKKKKKQNKTQS